jgi:hypothetical protein
MWADWDTDLLALEFSDLKDLNFDLSMTGVDDREIDELLADPDLDDRANQVPDVSENAVTIPGDLWLCGPHRILCSDATSPEAVARLLGSRKPLVLVTDPPYGIQLD